MNFMTEMSDMFEMQNCDPDIDYWWVQSPDIGATGTKNNTYMGRIPSRYLPIS
jgi:hypothetical protein